MFFHWGNTLRLVPFFQKKVNDRDEFLLIRFLFPTQRDPPGATDEQELIPTGPSE